jgi:putative tRNA adenosine deaminase-associated protein
MSYFAVALTRSGGRWRGLDVDLDGCESLSDLGDVLADLRGDIRLLFIEQDDEYAAIVRLDARDSEPRAFLSDGHAADSYPMAELIADDLDAVTSEPDPDDEDVPPVHESAPFGDASIVEDLGTAASDLIAMCVHQGTLPVDVLVAVCEKAGCVDEFETLRG